MIPTPKKRKINPMLFNVLLISGGIHLLAIFILGGITIVKYVIPDEAQFEEPPAIEEEAPPPEQQVEIRPQQAPQMNAMQNLSMRQVGNIAVAAVDVNLPGMQQSFTVSSGLGDLGTGGGAVLSGTRGSLGIGISDVSVFGLKTRAERILFVIDANRQMVTDKKGGLNSYKVIKDEITDMVGNLSAGTLFNVVLQDRRRILQFKPQLVPAGMEVHSELVKWIAPINSNATDVGLEGNKEAKTPDLTAMKAHEYYDALRFSGDRGNETAYLTQFALEQSVDAIFFITGYHRGFESIRRRPTDRENKDWERTTSNRDYIKQLEAYKAEIPIMEKRVADTLAKINAERKAKGMPPRVLAQRYGLNSNAHELGLEWENKHPGYQPAYFHEARDVERYFDDLVDVLYENDGGQAPSLNVVLFLAGDEDFSKQHEDRLDDYVDEFGGDYRVIRGLNEIKSARSAAGTKN